MFNPFDALNKIALAGAVKPDAESNLRFVMRWYSKTFSTPLHVVADELPIEDIWLAFFEERYRGMTRAELQEYIDLALETPEERNQREAAEQMEAASEKAFAEMSANAKPVPIPVASPSDLLTQVPSLPETTLPTEQMQLEPDIDMKFVDPEEMERLLDGGMAIDTK